MGEEEWAELILVTPIPIMAKLVWDRPPQPIVYLLVMEQGPQVQVREVPKDPKMVRVVFQTRRAQFTPVFPMSRLGPHGLGVCYLSKSLNQTWGTEGMWPIPHQQQPTVNLQHSLPNPESRPIILKEAQKRMTRGHPFP